MTVKNSRIGEASVLLAAALWGCIGIFTRNMFSAGFTSVQTVAVRAFITMAVMLCVILIKDRSLLKVRPRDLWIFAGTGICSYLFFNICYMASIGENSLSVACILLYTSPVWVTSLSAPIFKERLTVLKCVSLFVCFAGCALVCFSPSLVITGKGVIYGLLSGFGYALYSIFGKAAVGKYNSLTITFYTFLFASVGVVPLCGLRSLGTLITEPENLLWSVGIALICTILPYLLYTFGLSRINAGKAAVLSIIEPVVASVVGTAVYSEQMGVTGILGIITVISGLILLEKGKNN